RGDAASLAEVSPKRPTVAHQVEDEDRLDSIVEAHFRDARPERRKPIVQPSQNRRLGGHGPPSLGTDALLDEERGAPAADDEMIAVPARDLADDEVSVDHGLRADK